MNHAKNERIADSLRRLADHLEKSPHEYSSSIKSYGGDQRFHVADGLLIPIGFTPVGMALIVGDDDFVRSHAVIAIHRGDN